MHCVKAHYLNQARWLRRPPSLNSKCQHTVCGISDNLYPDFRPGTENL